MGFEVSPRGQPGADEDVNCSQAASLQPLEVVIISGGHFKRGNISSL